MYRGHCTYCSAKKRTDPDPLPALERYLDPRIRDLAAMAAAEGSAFLILSGEFGLLRPEDPIPWYDHLLSPEETDAMAARVAGQLGELGAASLVFHTVDPARDPLVLPYLTTIRAACDRADVTLEIVVLPD